MTMLMRMNASSRAGPCMHPDLEFLAIPGLYKALRGWPVLIYELLLADWHIAPASSAGIPADVAPGSARLYKAEDIGYRAGGAAI